MDIESRLVAKMPPSFGSIAQAAAFMAIGFFVAVMLGTTAKNTPTTGVEDKATGAREVLQLVEPVPQPVQQPVAPPTATPLPVTLFTGNIFQADAEEFTRMAHRCTDKTTTHRYQHLYARVLHTYKHRARTPSDPPKRFKMLEIGLGCDMECVAGGFRLFQAYVPELEYHVFEFNMELCISKYDAAGLTAAEREYLSTHLCRGNSANKQDLDECARRFGPFDVIVDDASHQQDHIIAAATYLFPSPHLKPGGTYVIEDLQTGFMGPYGGTESRQLAGNTGAGLLKELMDWKFAAHPYQNTQSFHIATPRRWASQTTSMGGVLQEMIVTDEACALIKRP